MVRFPSVLYPFSILLIFSSSDRLLLYCTCHRCAANAGIYAVSSESELQALLTCSLFIFLFLFHSRNLTLNDLGRCCGTRVTRQCTAFGNYWSGSLLDYYIGNLIFIRSDRYFFARNLLLSPTNDLTQNPFKISMP